MKTNRIRTSETTCNTRYNENKIEYVHPRQHTIQGTMRRQIEYVHPRQHTIQGTMSRQTEYVHPRQHTI